MEKKIKVLQVNKLYYPHIGGVEKHVQDLAEALRGKVDVSVLAANTEFRTVNETVGGVPVTKVASLGSVASAPLVPTFWRWLRRLQPDIYHFHFPYPIGELSYLLSRADRRLAVTYHSDIIRQKRLLAFYRPLMIRFLSQADVIMASSPNLIANSPVIGRFSEKCRVIPFGIDVERFRPTPRMEERAAEFRRLFGNKEVILFVGRLIYYKGLSYLVEAMPRIDAVLVLAGEGGLREELERQAAEVGVHDKVIFLGKAADEDLPALYYACDLFILPSIARSEAFGLVQLEAQACGKPVVSTNLPTGVPYANLDSETGIVVPPEDSDALATAINRLLNDPDLRRRLGEQGRRRVEREFTLKSMADAVMRVYEELMET